jgi:hypothetical protein
VVSGFTDAVGGIPHVIRRRGRPVVILPSGRLVVNVARSGGFLGRTVSWNATAEPASAVHDAVLAVLRLGPPDDVPRPSRDAFTYRVTVAAADDSGPLLLEASYHDPAPPAVADLLAAMGDPPSR